MSTTGFILSRASAQNLKLPAGPSPGRPRRLSYFQRLFDVHPAVQNTSSLSMPQSCQHHNRYRWAMKIHRHQLAVKHAPIIMTAHENQYRCRQVAAA